MEILFFLFLFIFGSIFGSFGSVLIYRLKSGEKGILTGRSHCAKCNHNLNFFDLFPIFSWIKNFGKCKYCKQKISIIYPLLEISTGIVFTLTGFFLIDFEKIFLFDFIEISKLFFWLTINFITILYIFYDLIFTEIHEGIMASGIFLAFLGLFLNNFFEINPLITSFGNISNLEIFVSLALGIAILGGFYIIMLKELKEIYDILILSLIGISFYIYKIFFPESIFSENFILSGIIGAFGIFVFFFLQIILSGGRALGGGDLRIGIMIGLLLGINFSILGIILTYIIGSIIGIFIIIKNFKNKKVNEVPFGPFLGIGFFLVLFFSENIINFMRNYFFFL